MTSTDPAIAGGRSDRSNKPIKLLLSDVDGTLVTKQKELTQASIDAVRDLHSAGIHFAVTSSRPPRGMQMLVEPLAIEMPLAGFNGGLYVSPDMNPIEMHSVPEIAARAAVEEIQRRQVGVWVFAGEDWYVLDADGPHVAHETHTTQFSPIAVSNFDAIDFASIGKIVAVSDDKDLMDRCQAVLQKVLGSDATASRSQSYYIDITNIDANKGAVVGYLSRFLKIDPAEIAVIGDMENDVRMFDKAGLAIAMGNADAGVKQKAHLVTKSNEEDGFAAAVRQFILR